MGELLLGHLRYGTHGGNSVDLCHPFIRENNWMSRNLMLAGNFNLTNVDELFDVLVGLGQHPSERADTVTMLEKFGHFIDEENQRLFTRYKIEGHSNQHISNMIAEELNVENILKRDGTHKEFLSFKIEDAIKKAFKSEFIKIRVSVFNNILTTTRILLITFNTFNINTNNINHFLNQLTFI